MNYNHDYPEICVPSSQKEAPPFPFRCPICCAEAVTLDFSVSQGPAYKCGGQYTLKPQIQNHTNKWWGSCPVKYLEGLQAESLLESQAVVWAVKENGRRIHVASFSQSSIAESFGRDFSKNYPRCWDDESKVIYIEVSGRLGGYSGVRYCKGEVIAHKATPHHIRGAGYDRVWFRVEEISLGSYQFHEILEDF